MYPCTTKGCFACYALLVTCGVSGELEKRDRELELKRRKYSHPCMCEVFPSRELSTSYLHYCMIMIHDCLADTDEADRTAGSQLKIWTAVNHQNPITLDVLMCIPGLLVIWKITYAAPRVVQNRYLIYHSNKTQTVITLRVCSTGHLYLQGL